MPKLQIAVEYTDGREEVVTVGRPADLIAFADHFRKVAPDSESPDLIREASWLVHRALRIDEPFEEWVQTLEGLELKRGPGTPVPAAEAAVEEVAADPPTPPSEEAETVVLHPPEWPVPRPHRTIATPTERAWPE